MEPGACLDLIIGDVPDGLPVPEISDVEDDVPSWNELNGNWTEPIFEFAQNFLQENGAILLFQPDILEVRDGTKDGTTAYGFNVLREWWGINEMYLTSSDDPKSMVCISKSSRCHLFTVISIL